jgi:hypothetical protein
MAFGPVNYDPKQTRFHVLSHLTSTDVMPSYKSCLVMEEGITNAEWVAF